MWNVEVVLPNGSVERFGGNEPEIGNDEFQYADTYSYAVDELADTLRIYKSRAVLSNYLYSSGEWEEEGDASEVAYYRANQWTRVRADVER